MQSVDPTKKEPLQLSFSQFLTGRRVSLICQFLCFHSGFFFFFLERSQKKFFLKS